MNDYQAPVKRTFIPSQSEGRLPAQVTLERLEIDRSTRLPVLVLFGAALKWLLIATVFALIASIKMHRPEFLSGVSWLTYGRIWPVYLDSFIYGWGVNVGMGVLIWLMTRLCRIPLQHPLMLVTATLFWNLGVLLGIVGILGGQNSGVEGLEFSSFATPLLFLSLVLMAVWGIITFRLRLPGHVYVSQWYLLAALFWFPWAYGSAQILLFVRPLHGVIQSIVGWWFADSMFGLWFSAIGLASAYYFIPKLIGKPVYNYYLSSLGFWTFAFFSCWMGMRHLIAAPVPIWIPTLGIVATFMMIIPVTVVAINQHMTLRNDFPLLLSSPTLRFTVFGAMCYTGFNLEAIFMSFRTINRIIEFTQYGVGHFQFGMYAFFTMTMFGAMYYIVPRLVGCEWRSAKMIKLHFWASFYGILLSMLLLGCGGLVEGFALNDPQVPFLEVVDRTQPFLVGRTIALILLTIAHFVFAYHFLLMLMRLGRPAGEATLFGNPVPEEIHPVQNREAAAI